MIVTTVPSLPPPSSYLLSLRACALEDGEACWLLSTWYMGNKTTFKKTNEGNKVTNDRRNGRLRRICRRLMILRLAT